MDAHTKQERIDLFKERCREQGLPFTVQRRLIVEEVLGRDDHPTADQIHESVSVRTPGISRTTVYRTLETLVRMRVVTKACHTGSAVRFDGRTDVHHHLVCLECDRMIDISDKQLDALPVPDTSSRGFVVTDFRVQLRGICETCRQEEDLS